jgi:hypothetical protein
MRLSHKHKFVFISIPKTGSTSARSMLEDYSDITDKEIMERNSPYDHHMVADDLKKYFDTNEWNWDDYFKFTVVRNPWAREVSLYEYMRNYKHEWEKGNRISKQYYYECCETLKKHPTFKDYITGQVAYRGVNYVYERYYTDKDGNDLLDFIGRCEDMSENIDFVCDKLQIPKIDVEYKNKTKHKPYIEYYDDVTKQIVAEKFQKAIERFGYKFGE